MTYIFRFDEAVNHVELDYPRNMSMFEGVGPNIDAVFASKNGKCNFNFCTFGFFSGYKNFDITISIRVGF